MVYSVGLWYGVMVWYSIVVTLCEFRMFQDNSKYVKLVSYKRKVLFTLCDAQQRNEQANDMRYDNSCIGRAEVHYRMILRYIINVFVLLQNNLEFTCTTQIYPTTCMQCLMEVHLFLMKTCLSVSLWGYFKSCEDITMHQISFWVWAQPMGEGLSM